MNEIERKKRNMSNCLAVSCRKSLVLKTALEMHRHQ